MMMRQVVLDQLYDWIDDGGFDADAFEKSAGNGSAGGFVAPGSPALLFAVAGP